MIALSARERLAFILYFFLVTGTLGVLQPFMPLYFEASGLNREQIGWVTGGATGLGLLLQPLWGWLSDHYDARRALIIFNALAAFGAYSLLRYAEGWSGLLVLCAVGANGSFYLNAAGGVLIGRLISNSGQGGGLYAGLRVWGSVGYIVTSLATGLGLILLSGTRVSFSRAELEPVFVYGPALFLLAAGVALFLPDPSREERGEGAGKAPWAPNFVAFLVCYFLYSFALYGASAFLSLYMKSLGANPLAISLMFAGGVLCEVFVMRRSGVLSDQYGRRPLLALTFLLLPVRMLLYMPATAPAWIMGVQVLHGINFGVMGAVSVALVNDMANDRTRGRLQARLFITAGVATTLAPALFGFLGQSYGLRAIFGAAAAVGLLSAAWFLLRVRETHPAVLSVEDRLPSRWRWLGRWLDAPPRVP